MKRIIGLFFTLVMFISAQAITKVACVGASITYGAFIEDREHNSFRGQLQSFPNPQPIVDFIPNAVGHKL